MLIKPLTLTPEFYLAGGDDRDRTDDPLLAKQVLSQLSYVPSSQMSVLSRQIPLKTDN